MSEYALFIGGVAGATILWRTLMDDHRTLREAVCRLPLIGGSFVCGVCTSYWFTLAALIAAGRASTPDILAYWLALGTAVLFVRSIVLATLDLAAILKHRHLQNHTAP